MSMFSRILCNPSKRSADATLLCLLVHVEPLPSDDIMKRAREICKLGFSESSAPAPKALQ
jgi:hypothetical protein